MGGEVSTENGERKAAMGSEEGTAHISISVRGSSQRFSRCARHQERRNKKRNKICWQKLGRGRPKTKGNKG
eukprot:1244801-Rhodomonas_salina.1